MLTHNHCSGLPGGTDNTSLTFLGSLFSHQSWHGAPAELYCLPYSMGSSCFPISVPTLLFTNLGKATSLLTHCCANMEVEETLVVHLCVSSATLWMVTTYCHMLYNVLECLNPLFWGLLCKMTEMSAFMQSMRFTNFICHYLLLVFPSYCFFTTYLYT